MPLSLNRVYSSIPQCYGKYTRHRSEEQSPKWASVTGTFVLDGITSSAHSTIVLPLPVPFGDGFLGNASLEYEYTQVVTELVRECRYD